MPVRGRIAVDLTLPIDPSTPLTPGSLPVRFMASLVQHVQDVEFVIVSRHGQIAVQALRALEGPNARHVVLREPGRLERLWWRGVGRVERSRRCQRLSGLARWLRARGVGVHAHVLLCPYTLNGWTASLPLVAAVDDVQHLSHPFLLSPTQRNDRAQPFESMVRRASRVLCSTETVREAVLQTIPLPRERLATLSPVSLFVEQASSRPGNDGYVLALTSLQPRNNDRLLLTAIGMHRATHADCALRFVLAAAGGPELARLRLAIDRMGLASVVKIVLAEPSESAMLVESCRALIIPALYQTVDDVTSQAVATRRGMPIARAGAAFDPHNPAELAAWFNRIESKPVEHPQDVQLAPPDETARAFVNAALAAAT